MDTQNLVAICHHRDFRLKLRQGLFATRISRINLHINIEYL